MSQPSHQSQRTMIERVASSVGITLTPWQVEFMLHVLDTTIEDEPVVEHVSDSGSTLLADLREHTTVLEDVGALEDQVEVLANAQSRMATVLERVLIMVEERNEPVNANVEAPRMTDLDELVSLARHLQVGQMITITPSHTNPGGTVVVKVVDATTINGEVLYAAGTMTL